MSPPPLACACRLRHICAQAAEGALHIPVWAICLDPHDPAGCLHTLQLLCEQHLRRAHVVPPALLSGHHQRHRGLHLWWVPEQHNNQQLGTQPACLPASAQTCQVRAAFQHGRSLHLRWVFCRHMFLWEMCLDELVWCLLSFSLNITMHVGVHMCSEAWSQSQPVPLFEGSALRSRLSASWTSGLASAVHIPSLFCVVCARRIQHWNAWQAPLSPSDLAYADCFCYVVRQAAGIVLAGMVPPACSRQIVLMCDLAGLWLHACFGLRYLALCGPTPPPPPPPGCAGNLAATLSFCQPASGHRGSTQQ